MDEAEASELVWREQVRRRLTAEQDRDTLAHLIEYDADPFEVELYELAADPRTLLIDRAQRHRVGQHERQVRPVASTEVVYEFDLVRGRGVVT
ncbi:hypothetical protein ACGFJT_29445 [Actinomadura geliboluensis]|uniref:hypothetical protein n=1 Tax=Actinomadura geliboluensis TaxID=882440 RepID=UPI003715D83F